MNKTERFYKAYHTLVREKVIKNQQDVADAMGASRSNVSSALNGRESVLTDSFLMRFARAFNQISLPWLLNEDAFSGFGTSSSAMFSLVRHKS